jgi:hypothetical protein
MWCKITGNEILEGPKEWPGKFIPIIPCLGEEVWINGERFLRSAIRHAIDAAKLYNWARSNNQETLALSPKQPWILSGEQLDEYKPIWDKAYLVPRPYLPYKHVDGQPPPQRLGGSMPDTGANQEAMIASDDIKATIGRYDASLGARSNETSGIAINARKVQGDDAIFVFEDNKTRAIRHTGRVLIDLIPKIYDTEMIVRLMGENLQKQFGQLQGAPPNGVVIDSDGRTAWANINIVDKQGNVIANDLSVGEYDVVADTGPGYATRREEATVGMIELARHVPESMPVLAPRIAKNQDWPESDDIGDELKQIFTPQPPQASPHEQLALQKGQIELQKGEIELNKSRIELMKIEAELEGKVLDNEGKELAVIKAEQDIRNAD